MQPPEKRARAKEEPKPSAEAQKRRSVIDGAYVSKLDDAVTQKVVQAIRGGATIETAAKYAQIHKTTFHRWLQLGRDALMRKEAGSLLDGEWEALEPFADFVSALDLALSSFKLSLTSNIQAAGLGKDGQPGQWTALAWLAERRWPDEFGRRQRIDHANADGTPFAVTAAPNIDVSKLSSEELDTLIALYEKARPDSVQAPAEREPPLLESG